MTIEKEKELPLRQVICGDCLEVMKGWPDAYFDACITDPPFGIGLKYTNSDSIFNVDHDNPDDYYAWLSLVLKQIHRICKDGAFIAVWQSPKYFRYFWKWFGDDFHIFINAHNFGASINDKFMFSRYFPVICYSNKNGSPLLPKSRSLSRDFFLSDMAGPFGKPKDKAPEKEHPCARPLDAVEYLVENFTVENAIVIDPFLGSGTLAVACESKRRRWLGIEINPDYCEIARKRLEPWMNQSRLDGVFGVNEE